jgi:hypothetical protein
VARFGTDHMRMKRILLCQLRDLVPIHPVFELMSDLFWGKSVSMHGAGLQLT